MALSSRIKKRSYYFLLAPTLITVIVLIIIPLLGVVGLGFNKFSLMTPDKNRFVGFDNYLRLLGDERFWSSLRVALVYGVGSVFFQVFFGLLLALLLAKKFRATIGSRTLFLIPMTVPPIAASLMWALFFTPSIPGINYLLSVFGIRGPSWFDHPVSALSAIIIANVWQWVPFCMILILATLESLPTDPFESAVIDGANGLQVFWYLTLPLIRPTILFVATYRIIESLKVFALVHVMTGGGPGIATMPVNYYAYMNAFEYNKMGYGSSIVVLMLILVVLIVLFMTKVVGIRRAH
jgi:multiple sugar transport system permease protein